MNTDVLDLALGNAEKLYAALRAFRELVGEISDWQQECARAKAAAAAAQKSLADITQQLAAAQSKLDQLNSERAASEKRVQELAAQHAALTADINKIKQMVAA